MGKMYRLSFVLFLITAVTGTILGGVYTVTKEPISQTKIREKKEALEITLPSATEFKTLKLGTDPEGSIKEINLGTTDSKLVGYNFTVSSKGYAGLIEMVVGINSDGQVAGIKILNHQETPGLGAQATDLTFLSQFKNKKAEKFSVVKIPTKEETEIQAISGATITTDAVVVGVNEALDFWKENFQEEGKL